MKKRIQRIKDKILEFLADYWGLPLFIIVIVLAVYLGHTQR